MELETVDEVIRGWANETWDGERDFESYVEELKQSFIEEYLETGDPDLDTEEGQHAFYIFVNNQIDMTDSEPDFPLSLEYDDDNWSDEYPIDF